VAATRVFVDANVLYSRTLRDWLMLLQLRSGGEIYSVYWSEDVLAEAIYRLRRSHPDWDGGKITYIRDLITQVFEGGRVDDFVVDGSFGGNDANDRHVHAAALACSADIVLSDDGGFFSAAEYDERTAPYESYRPDEFFLLVDDSSPDLVRKVTLEQTIHWRNKTGRADLAGPLAAAGCTRFGQRVRTYQGSLSIPNTNDLP
jgi:hypothetical protein